ncbi:8135_t:CDS:2, partial [Ambispora leptoticha]
DTESRRWASSISSTLFPHLGKGHVFADIIMEVWLPVKTASDLLVSNLGRIKNKKVHILVAQAFIPNPENKLYVNHINGIRCDNRAINLEWVTPKENAERTVFRNPGRSSTRIIQKSLDGNVVHIWDSITLASNTLNIVKNYVKQDPNEEWREIEINLRKFRVSSLGRVWLRNEYVNHIDGDSTNNKASNLEWCTPKENNYHAVRIGLQRQCGVKQIFDDGSFREFPSIAEARRVTGINHIGLVCRGFQRHAGGYRWEYVTQ